MDFVTYLPNKLKVVPDLPYKICQHLKNVHHILVAEIGWDGIECPVRPGGHVLPERVDEDLPKMVESLKKRNLDVLMATTRIYDISELHAETILRTFADLGIQRYCIGGCKYKKDMLVPDRLKEVEAQIKGLVELNKKLGISAAYQNHSATGVGAAVWDIYFNIKEFDTKHIGVAFDIGHATIEGGYAWPIHFNEAISKNNHSERL